MDTAFYDPSAPSPVCYAHYAPDGKIEDRHFVWNRDALNDPAVRFEGDFILLFGQPFTQVMNHPAWFTPPAPQKETC